MLKRIQRALRRHRLSELPSLIVKNLRHYWTHLRSGAEASEVSQFDQHYGTDTSSIREISSLKIDSHNELHAERYQASGPRQFHAALRLLGGNFKGFTFVDFGSGKGRTLLLASHYPFSAILGVEFSSELHEIALRNISVYRDDEQLSTGQQSVLADATKFQIPDGPLVCYFYNPFGKEVLRDVVGTIEQSMRAQPRDVYAVYLEPLHGSVFKTSAHWKLMHEQAGISVFRGLTSGHLQVVDTGATWPTPHGTVR